MAEGLCGWGKFWLREFLLKLLAEGIGIAMNGQINVTFYK